MKANSFEGAGGEGVEVGSHRLRRAHLSESAQKRFKEVAYGPSRYHTVIGEDKIARCYTHPPYPEPSAPRLDHLEGAHRIPLASPPQGQLSQDEGDADYDAAPNID